MSSTPAAAVSPGESAQNTLRRLILYALLFTLVVITAIGLSGLLERLFSSGSVLASADVAGLSRALAFTLIGGPLAALLWWLVWKRLDDGVERRSPAWGIYLAAVYAVSLIVSVTALLGMAASFIGRQEPQWHSPLSTGIVWAGIWIWHRWMWRHPARHPVNLDDVPAVIGWVFGLLAGTFAATAALAGLLDAAIMGFNSLTPAVGAWWQPVLRALVWTVGGSIVWWWHWFRDGRKLRTALVDVAVVCTGIFAAGAMALAGAGVVVFVLLRLAFDRSGPMSGLLAPLGPATAAMAVGALVWRYHRVSGTLRSGAARRASLLVTSGLALAAAASGIGVVINAALAMAVSPLAGDGARTLLLGGISSLLVGGPVWWHAWKPARQPQTAEAIPPGRRVYLIVFFGLSAVVALIALLVIGYRLFEFVLGDGAQASFLERVRGQLGLLVAAGLVAAYHFGLWWRERILLAAASPKTRTVEHVTLVTSLPPEPLCRAISDATGARIMVWKRADAVREPLSAEAGLRREAEMVERVSTALAGVRARSILLVIGHGTQVEVIPLETGTS